MFGFSKKREKDLTEMKAVISKTDYVREKFLGVNFESLR